MILEWFHPKSPGMGLTQKKNSEGSAAFYESLGVFRGISGGCREVITRFPEGLKRV